MSKEPKLAIGFKRTTQVNFKNFTEHTPELCSYCTLKKQV